MVLVGAVLCGDPGPTEGSQPLGVHGQLEPLQRNHSRVHQRGVRKETVF